MSSYASIADLRLAFRSELFYTNRAAIGGPVAIPDNVLQRCLDDATDEMNTYLRSQNMPPFTSWGNDVRRRCVDIAMYRVMIYRGFNPEEDRLFDKLYEEALNWLRDVANGKLNPEIEDATPAKNDGMPSIVTGQSGNLVGNGFFGTYYGVTKRGW